MNVKLIVYFLCLMLVNCAHVDKNLVKNINYSCNQSTDWYVDQNFSDNEIKLIRDAISSWEEKAQCKFLNKIFYINCVENPTQFHSICLAEFSDYAVVGRYYPVYSLIQLKKTNNKVMFLKTMVHEFGHFLGLEHNLHSNSIMYQYIFPTQNQKILAEDIMKIEKY